MSRHFREKDKKNKQNLTLISVGVRSGVKPGDKIRRGELADCRGAAQLKSNA